MPQYSDIQKKIALALLAKSLTAEALADQLKLPHEAMLEELKGLMKLGMVQKEGFPTQYRLLDSVVAGVRTLKEREEKDYYWVRVRIIIEARSIEESLLQKELSRIEKLLQEDAEFTVYQSTIHPVAREESHYLSYIEASLGVKQFKSLIKLMFHYGPASVEVIKPASLQLSAHELQEGLLDVSQMVQLYTQYIAQTMSKQDLAKFYHELYRPAQ